MGVTAKFVVARNTDMNWASEIELVPDYAQGRNKEWSEATPAGMIRLTVTNKDAVRLFPVGQPMTVTFEPEEDRVVVAGSGSPVDGQIRNSVADTMEAKQ